MYTANTYGRKQGQAIVLFSGTFTVSAVSSVFAAVTGASPSVAWPFYAATTLSIAAISDAVIKTAKVIALEEKYAERKRDRDQNKPKR